MDETFEEETNEENTEKEEPKPNISPNKDFYYVW